MLRLRKTASERLLEDHDSKRPPRKWPNVVKLRRRPSHSARIRAQMLNLMSKRTKGHLMAETSTQIVAKLLAELLLSFLPSFSLCSLEPVDNPGARRAFPERSLAGPDSLPSFCRALSLLTVSVTSFLLSFLLSFSAGAGGRTSFCGAFR